MTDTHRTAPRPRPFTEDYRTAHPNLCDCTRRVLDELDEWYSHQAAAVPQDTAPTRRAPTEKQRTSPKVHTVYDPSVPVPRNGHRIPYDSGLPFGGRIEGKIRLTAHGPAVLPAEGTSETPEQTTERVAREQRDAQARAAFSAAHRETLTPTTVFVPRNTTRGIPHIAPRRVSPQDQLRIARDTALLMESVARDHAYHLMIEGYTEGL
ncbi:hypothetical protein P5W04_10295 [Mycobacteroides abscessus subsp. abscessus]|uniref:hypothetical protein n=1 Tax=Mycobacteroides abscessus TaxID=36809 RepID=UPI000E68800E|nr:hypothetical protein [Mycobacteroides abscessus]MBN7484555.1 hypothetical protein [Mycobacteroides abscessus subsp. abscessus]MDO3240504.1 hypothetical protein [Mycobacteroides abscessus subsp. abscessus]RIT74998.1 hypothetical protein D2E77_01565 [Mycobacteroides abscessus]